MKMPRAGNVIQINMFRFQSKDSPRIGQNIAPISVLQDYGETGLTAGVPDDFFNMHAAGGEPLQCDVSKGVAAYVRNKTHAAAERSQIMRHDGGRTAKRQHHILGEQFAFGGQRFGKSVEDQVNVEFSSNGDIELWQ